VSKISVKRIDNQNNDLTVVNAARVSFDKIKNKITNRDIRLIRYLAEHNHFTPFTHVRFGAMTVMSSQQDFQNMAEFMGCPERSADMIFRKRMIPSITLSTLYMVGLKTRYQLKITIE